MGTGLYKYLVRLRGRRGGSMANLNKVMLIGRLTRDPEIKTFSNGGKVANIGFAVNNRRKNQQSGQWEDVPVWLDLKAFNRETGRKMADMIEQYLRKGQQVYVEGHLVLEEWEGKTDGKKQSKLVIYVDDFQFLEKREGAAKGEVISPIPGKAAEGMDEVPF
ncbi:MAG TPA: single-stranded DNA-binding protein [Elusimicrobia bacterium]|nr:single-stranded DNA-binding protein [Elusimicrobiota bacterium]